MASFFFVPRHLETGGSETGGIVRGAYCASVISPPLLKRENDPSNDLSSAGMRRGDLMNAIAKVIIPGQPQITG